MSKDNGNVITGQWNGHKQYRCRLCSFDSLDKAGFEDHFAKVHQPLQVIEGRRAKAQNPETMTREELNAYATSVGVEDPAALQNKADVIAAIEAAQKGKE